MIERFHHLLDGNSPVPASYRPQFFRLQASAEDRKSLAALLESGAVYRINDALPEQLRELLKLRYPTKRIAASEYDALIRAHVGPTAMEDYGVWVFYPWSGRLVHLLDEAEYAEVRTNRNKHKITAEEQAVIGSKRIGVVGLSVGQSVALALAMERSFGELRLADFDVLELSNMNRIRSSVHEMGQLKVVNTAREIAEIDPFLKVTVFPNGLTEDNIDAFFEEGGKLDMLMEECDSLEIKIRSRIKAKELRIPVLMDTSDRGMVDVERFDTEPDRELLHGLARGLDVNRLSEMTPQEKLPFLMQLAGYESLSPRMKASLPELGKTLTAWPQLATSVILGGAVVAELARKIFTGVDVASGRYYFDPEEVLKRNTLTAHSAPQA